MNTLWVLLIAGSVILSVLIGRLEEFAKAHPSFAGGPVSSTGLTFPECLSCGPGAIPNSELRMWNSEYFIYFLNPHSAIRIPQFQRFSFSIRHEMGGFF
jgi:hypothetical protein